MAIITTGSHPKALWPGVKAWWGLKYDEHVPEYPALFDAMTSDKHYEEIVQSTGFGLAPVKAQGAPITYDTTVQGFTTRVVHVTYGLGYVVTWEEKMDNLYPELSNGRAGANAFSMRQTKEIVGANIYNRAFNASFLGGDGVALLSSAHPNTSGGTFSNLSTLDLSEAALEDICIQIMGVLNDRGLNISIMPKTLIVPRQLWFEANRILKSTLQPDTTSNNLNVLKATNAFPGGIVMNHYLTDIDAWFVKTNVQYGMCHYTRSPIEFAQDNDFDTKNAKAYSIERYSFAWGDPRALFGSAGV